MLAYYDLHTRLNEIWDIGENYVHIKGLVIRDCVRSHRAPVCRAIDEFIGDDDVGNFNEDINEFRERNFFPFVYNVRVIAGNR